MTVDFHVHSTASDGTCSPSELTEKAKGFAAIALTDHDNCDGLEDWKGIPGIELSIEPGEGFDKFHLLGLGIDPLNTGLKDFLRRVLDGRNARNARIIENFRRLGIEMPDVESYAHGEVLARPHFARWLVDRGHAADIRDAFAKYLLPDSPVATRCYEERWHPPQEEHPPFSPSGSSSIVKTSGIGLGITWQLITRPTRPAAWVPTSTAD